MTKILAIISTHGNELLGPNVLAYMLSKRSKLLENIEFIIANPLIRVLTQRMCGIPNRI